MTRIRWAIKDVSRPTRMMIWELVNKYHQQIIKLFEAGGRASVFITEHFPPKGIKY